MSIFYEPCQLASAKIAVEEMLPRIAEGFRPSDEEDECFKIFLEKLVHLASNKVVSFAQKSDEELITKLACYTCTNKYGYNYDNIFTCLKETAKAFDYEFLCDDWLDHYENAEVQAFLASVHRNNENFLSFLKRRKVQSNNLEWIEKKDIVNSFAELVKDIDDVDLLSGVLAEHGVTIQSALGRLIRDKFVLICNGKAYKKMGDSLLSNIFSGLTFSDKILFCANFVENVIKEPRGVIELDAFVETYKKINLSFTSIQRLLKTILSERGLWYVFLSWCEKMKMIIFFEGDINRKDFWKQYHPTKIIETDNDEILVMQYDSYIVTECKGKGAGPAYIMSEEFYDAKIKYKINSSELWQIKTLLRSSYEKGVEGVYALMEHRPAPRGWWRDFSYQLRRYGIVKT